MPKVKRPIYSPHEQSAWLAFTQAIAENTVIAVFGLSDLEQAFKVGYDAGYVRKSSELADLDKRRNLNKS